MPEVSNKRRLLEVATRLFARHGFEGTSVSAIVDGAGVNKRMLYHYFGNKEGLYRAVFVHQWSAFSRWLRARLAPISARPPGPERSRAQFVEATEAFFDYMARRPRFVRLISTKVAPTHRVSGRTTQPLSGERHLICWGSMTCSATLKRSSLIFSE